VSTVPTVRSGAGFIRCLRPRATRRRRPSRVAVDEKQIEVGGEKKWLYAAVDIDSKLLLEVDIYSRRGTDPAAFTRTQFSCNPSEISDF